MVCIFGDDDSAQNSHFELDAIVHGGYSEGDSDFGDLSIASRDHQDICRQYTLRDSNEPDEEVNGTVGNRGVPGAVIMRSEAENNALAALVNCNTSGRPNQPSNHIAPANPSERRGGDESGTVATSRATQPLQSNNAEEVCRASAEPTVPSDNASSTAEVSTAASGVTARSGWEENGVPSVRSKEAHDLLNRNEAVFISLDLETAREEVGVVQLSAEISRLDLVQHQNEKGGACRGSVRRDRRQPGARGAAGRRGRAAPRAERRHVRVGRRGAG